MIPQSPTLTSPPCQHLMFLLSQLVLLFLLLFQLSSHFLIIFWSCWVALLVVLVGLPTFAFGAFFHPVCQRFFHHHHRHLSPRLENLLKLQSSCCSCPPWSESCRDNPFFCELLLHKCSSGTCHLHELDVGTCIVLLDDILDLISKSGIWHIGCAGLPAFWSFRVFTAGLPCPFPGASWLPIASSTSARSIWWSCLTVAAVGLVSTCAPIRKQWGGSSPEDFPVTTLTWSYQEHLPSM